MVSGGEPLPTPTPRYGAGTDVVQVFCTPWGSCASGWANVIYNYHPTGDTYVVVQVTCVSEDACIASTPEPTDPTVYPCDTPPIVGSGIEQYCPPWDVCATVQIPPAKVLRNPWPRSLVGYPTTLWYEAPGDVSNWSDKAVPCGGVDYGTEHDDSCFTCDEGHTVCDGSSANYQIAVAWRQWNAGDPAIFGDTPPAENSWTVHDRDFNGGTVAGFGTTFSHVFETSSYGLSPDGPVWNPECQERECDCDERVLSNTGSEAYNANVTTYWWPEWNMRWDYYTCVRRDCDDVWVWDDPSCTVHGCDGHWEEDCHCEKYGWRRHEEGWTKYNLKDLGFASALYPWSSAIVAGADPDGNRCGSWIDSGNIPIPVLEVQPVAAED